MDTGEKQHHQGNVIMVISCEHRQLVKLHNNDTEEI